MSALSRKDFIKLSSWGFIAALLPVEKINAISSFINDRSVFNPSDFELAVAKAQIAKQKFFQKDYALAEQNYLDAIALAPHAIRFYDGLDNVYGAQGKTAESALMYKEALGINLTKIAFYDRAARALMRLEIGKKNAAANYRTHVASTSLLADAKALYIAAIAIDNTKPYLNVGLNKVQYKIDTNAINLNYNTSVENKLRRKTNRNIQKGNVKLFYTEQTTPHLFAMIEGIGSRPRNTLYTPEDLLKRQKAIVLQKKEYYRELLQRELSQADRISYAQALLALDPSDSYSYGMIRKVYYKYGMFSDFIGVSSEFHNIKNNAQTALSLMHATYIARTKNPNSDINTAITIGNTLLTEWDLRPEFKVKVVDKLAQLYMTSENYVEAKAVLRNFFQEMIDDTNLKVDAFSINQLIYRFCKVYIDNNEAPDGHLILLTALGEVSPGQTPHPLIASLLTNVDNGIFKDKLNLYYLLYTLCIFLNNEKDADVVLNKIRSYDPYDKFLLTRTL